MDQTGAAAGHNQRIVDIALDEHSIKRWSLDIDHERKVAIFDLLEANYFAPTNGLVGPFHLFLAIEENRLLFHIRDPGGHTLDRVLLPVTPFRRIVKDYFQICESYFEAIKTASPSRIEAIDMGRRGVHDEGSTLLRERLADRIAIDQNTARRLFTLICVLHLRG